MSERPRKRSCVFYGSLSQITAIVFAAVIFSINGERFISPLFFSILYNPTVYYHKVCIYTCLRVIQGGFLNRFYHILCKDTRWVYRIQHIRRSYLFRRLDCGRLFRTLDRLIPSFNHLFYMFYHGNLMFILFKICLALSSNFI